MTEENPSMFVSAFYEMDPLFEDLLPDGSYLKSGMIVLIEDTLARQDIDRYMNPYELARARECNRWCTVSDVTFNRNLVRFVASYGDGTKKIRMYHKSYAWFVKLDSIPDGQTLGLIDGKLRFIDND